MAEVVPQHMERGTIAILDQYPQGLMVKQTRRGCLQELFCPCDAKIEFKISPLDQKSNDIMYSREDSHWLHRWCCKPLRPFTQVISAGSGPGGPTVMTLKKPWACGLGPCLCCCHPNIDFLNADGSSLGSTIVPFYFCIPNLVIKDGAGIPQYHLHMPTCLGGVCCDCKAEGLCNCKIPFYIYKPDNDTPGQEIGKVIKIWRGLATEILTDADTFTVEYPKDCSTEDKARLLGSTIFLNFVYFERQKDN